MKLRPVDRNDLVIGFAYYDCESTIRELLLFVKRDSTFLYFKGPKQSVYSSNDEGFITFSAHVGSSFFERT
jgi:hypothetical protein